LDELRTGDEGRERVARFWTRRELQPVAEKRVAHLVVSLAPE
jgi:hypothetical protein